MPTRDFYSLIYPNSTTKVSLDCPFLLAHSVFSNVYLQLLGGGSCISCPQDAAVYLGFDTFYSNIQPFKPLRYCRCLH